MSANVGRVCWRPIVSANVGRVCWRLSVWNILFDGLGVFFIGRGVVGLVRQRSGT